MYTIQYKKSIRLTFLVQTRIELSSYIKFVIATHNLGGLIIPLDIYLHIHLLAFLIMLLKTIS